MECQEVGPFVSALHDSEAVPAEVARHVAGCAACRLRLQDYSELGTQLRLLASAEQGSQQEQPALALPAPRRRWFSARNWTARVLVPRFAVALGFLAIVGLSVGLGYVQARDRGPWFQFEIFPSEEASAGGWQLAEPGRPGGRNSFLFANRDGAVGCLIEVLENRDGALRLGVRAQQFPPGVDHRNAMETLKTMPAKDYWYVPGQKLVISPQGGGQLWLTGELLSKRPEEWPGTHFFGDRFFVMSENQIRLSNPALVRGKELVFRMDGGSATASGDSGKNPGVAAYVQGQGLLVVALEPFAGAVEGQAYLGQARFTLEGQEHLLFSATAITGSKQPRRIWVYRDPNYVSPDRSAKFISSPEVSKLLTEIGR